MSFNLLDQKIEDYIAQNASEEEAILAKIDRETHLEVLMPRMLSGHTQGLLLSMLSNLKRPQNILEIGTYTGYATICLATGLRKGGRLVTIDINEELEERVRSYFEEAGISHKTDYLIGTAVELIPTLDMMFDLVFIDADKANYSTYFDLVIDKVTAGGMIIADNVLWSGKVIDENKKDKDTVALREFNDKIKADHRVRNFILPYRDGLMLMEKVC